MDLNKANKELGIKLELDNTMRRLLKMQKDSDDLLHEISGENRFAKRSTESSEEPSEESSEVSWLNILIIIAIIATGLRIESIKSDVTDLDNRCIALDEALKQANKVINRLKESILFGNGYFKSIDGAIKNAIRDNAPIYVSDIPYYKDTVIKYDYYEYRDTDYQWIYDVFDGEYEHDSDIQAMVTGEYYT